MQKFWVLLTGFFILSLSGFAQSQKRPIGGLDVAVKMADSEIKQFPEPWAVDFNPKPVWNYTQGLVAQSMLMIWKESKDEAFFNYAKSYADKLIDASGNISGYKAEEYNLDCMNSGKFLFELYDRTKDE